MPFRFIRPFFAAETQGLKYHEVNPRLRDLAERTFRAESPALYRFVNSEIEFSEAWFVYLLEQMEVLRGFVNWHLLRYLQARNPNVSHISGKLATPEARDLTDAKRFWRAAIKDSAAGRCIYSGLELTVRTSQSILQSILKRSPSTDRCDALINGPELLKSCLKLFYP